jgi:hypothetical protein
MRGGEEISGLRNCTTREDEGLNEEGPKNWKQELKEESEEIERRRAMSGGSM